MHEFASEDQLEPGRRSPPRRTSYWLILKASRPTRRRRRERTRYRLGTVDQQLEQGEQGEQGEPYLGFTAERDFAEVEALPSHELEHTLARSRENELP